MHYTQWIDYLKEAPFFGKKSGLDNIKMLMNYLGNPQDELKIIHVAGTNGKGSVCAMTSQILMEEGYQVGTFTSPHLVSYNERIRIQMEPISDESFAKIGTDVIEAMERMEKEGHSRPTFFEIMTACAFLHFARQKVDYVLLEVGLGGRLDATNIIKEPIVCVITPIDYDHIHILGSTIEEIADEKCGIIKKHRPVVLLTANKSVYNRVNAHVLENSGYLYSINEGMSVELKEHTIDGSKFSVSNEFYQYDDLELSLLGHYQLSNACLVLLLTEVLKREGIFISEKSIRLGLKNAKWPGRMEVIKDKENVFLLDGAHNHHGMKNYLKFLSHIGHHPRHLIIGFNKDKDFVSMLQLVKESKELIQEIIFTPILSPKSVTVEDLPEDLLEGMYLASNTKDALKRARSITGREGLICCAGSLYLVGEMRDLIIKGKDVDL